MRIAAVSILLASIVALAWWDADAARRASEGFPPDPPCQQFVAPPEEPPTTQPASIAVYFSPDGGATQAIVDRINAATLGIRVQAYSFTSPQIAKALVDAHGRGVEILVVLDKSQQTEKYSSATYLANHGIPVLIDRSHAIAHNKVIIIDGYTIITGSFNFTRAAEERNAENVLIIDDHTDVARQYVKNFEEHAEHSVPYQPPAGE